MENTNPTNLSGKALEEFNNATKVLIVGNVQTGKSSLINSLSKEEHKIPVGDGSLNLTANTAFYSSTLIGTDQKVVFIDTQGFDNPKLTEEQIV